MNTKETENVVDLSGELFTDKVWGKGFIQKILSKKRLILRRTFFFLLGLTLYLICSSL